MKLPALLLLALAVSASMHFANASPGGDGTGFGEQAKTAEEKAHDKHDKHDKHVKAMKVLDQLKGARYDTKLKCVEAKEAFGVEMQKYDDAKRACKEAQNEAFGLHSELCEMKGSLEKSKRSKARKNWSNDDRAKEISKKERQIKYQRELFEETLAKLSSEQRKLETSKQVHEEEHVKQQVQMKGRYEPRDPTIRIKLEMDRLNEQRDALTRKIELLATEIETLQTEYAMGLQSVAQAEEEIKELEKGCAAKEEELRIAKERVKGLKIEEEDAKQTYNNANSRKNELCSEAKRAKEAYSKVIKVAEGQMIESKVLQKAHQEAEKDVEDSEQGRAIDGPAAITTDSASLMEQLQSIEQKRDTALQRATDALNHYYAEGNRTKALGKAYEAQFYLEQALKEHRSAYYFIRAMRNSVLSTAGFNEYAQDLLNKSSSRRIFISNMNVEMKNRAKIAEYDNELDDLEAKLEEARKVLADCEQKAESDATIEECRDAKIRVRKLEFEYHDVDRKRKLAKSEADRLEAWRKLRE